LTHFVLDPIPLSDQLILRAETVETSHAPAQETKTPLPAETRIGL